MEAEIYKWLSTDNGFAVQIAIFILLILGGLGFPIPEDIPLLLGGVAAANRIAPLQNVFVICYVGVMAGDQIMFYIGHRFGHKLLNAGTRSSFFPLITEDKVNEIREGLRKRRLLYIFIGRHLFPIRSVTFITAGALRIPFWEFFAADALAALVSVTLMIGLGYWLGGTLTPETVEKLAHEANVVILVLVALVIGAYFTRRYLKKRSAKKAAREEAKQLSAFHDSV